MPRFALKLFPISGSKVTSNPFESTLIAAEKIEVFIYYACGLIIIIQLFIALSANVGDHFGVHGLKILVGDDQYVYDRMLAIYPCTLYCKANEGRPCHRQFREIRSEKEFCCTQSKVLSLLKIHLLCILKLLISAMSRDALISQDPLLEYQDR